MEVYKTISVNPLLAEKNMQGSNSVETVDYEWRPIPSFAPLPLVLHREIPFGRTAMVLSFWANKDAISLEGL